jgi:hypothetical protein
MVNVDSWMEDRLNGGYGHILDQLQEDDWEETESDDGHRDLYAAEFEGHGTYEDYEPNPYDGTYSEM